MKRNPLLDTVESQIVDPSAVTLEEIMVDRCISRGRASEIRDMNLATGAWEQVWKKKGPRMTRAYRLTKKKH